MNAAFFLLLAQGFPEATGQSTNEECMNCDDPDEDNSIGIPTVVFPLLAGAFILVVLVVAGFSSPHVQDYRKRLMKDCLEKCPTWRGCCRGKRASSVAPADEECEAGAVVDLESKGAGEDEQLECAQNSHELSSAMAEVLDVAVKAHQDSPGAALLDVAVKAHQDNPGSHDLKLDFHEPQDEAAENRSPIQSGALGAREREDANGSQEVEELPEQKELPGALVKSPEELPSGETDTPGALEELPAQEPSGQNELPAPDSSGAHLLSDAIPGHDRREPPPTAQTAMCENRTPSATCLQADVSKQEDMREDCMASAAGASTAPMDNKFEVEESNTSVTNDLAPEVAAGQESVVAGSAPTDADSNKPALASHVAKQEESKDETEMPRSRTPPVLPPLKMPPRRGLGGTASAASAALGGPASAYAMRKFGSKSQVSRPGVRSSRTPSPEAGLVEGQPLVDGSTVVLWKGSRSSVEPKAKSVTPR